MNLKEQKDILEKKLKKIDSKIKNKNKTVRSGKTKFYHFSQNNSGGDFEEDENVCHHVFIEAHSAKEANALADNFGIYFDGCDNGIDCSCCGDRWSEVDEDDGTDKPMIYDASDKMVDVKKAFAYLFTTDCIIHYLDGRKEHIKFKTEKDCLNHVFKNTSINLKKCIICGKWEKEGGF